MERVPHKFLNSRVLLPVAPYILIIFGVIIFYFHLIILNGYPFFGNFFQPISSRYINFILGLHSITWNPLLDRGTPVLFPLNWVIGNSSSYGLMYLLGSSLNLTLSFKLYIIISTLFISISFYLLTGEFTHSIVGRLAGTVFLTFNPFFLQLIVNGDVPITLGFFFISILLLSRGINREREINLNTIASIAVLITSIGYLQIFYLGTLIYSFMFVLFHFRKNNFDFKRSVYAITKSLLFYIPLITAVFVWLILMYKLSPINIAPGSELSLPISTFAYYTQSFIDVLILKSYPPNIGWSIVLSTYKLFFYNIWSYFEIAFLMFSILVGIIFKNKMSISLSIFLVGVSLIGSGAQNFLRPFVLFLYQNFPGFQLINASYFWDWIAVVPIYSILIATLAQQLSMSVSKHSHFWPGSRKYAVYSKQILLVLNSKKKVSLANLAVIVSVLIIVMPPIASQSYYGNQGIHSESVPSYFLSLENRLTKITNISSGSIVYLPSDPNIYVGNGSELIQNPLIWYPDTSTIDVPTYGEFTYANSHYLYWLEQLLYLNETSNLGMLASLIGVEFFVLLNNVSSASGSAYYPWANGKNITAIMSLQKGINLYEKTANFAIYKNKFYNGNAISVKKFAIVLGDFNELNVLASDGVELNNYIILFPQDLSSYNISYVLNNTAFIAEQNNNSIYSLYMHDLSSQYIKTFSAAKYVGSGWNYKTNWIDSEGLLDWPLPVTGSVDSFALTQSKSVLNVTIGVSIPKNSAIYVCLLNDNLTEYNVTIEKAAPTGFVSKVITLVNTIKDTFNWLALPTSVDETPTKLTISQLNGNLVGISNLVFVNETQLLSAKTEIENKIAESNITVINSDSNITDKVNNLNQHTPLSSDVDKETVQVIENGNGFVIYSNNVHSILVRTNYFGKLIVQGKDASLYPSLGGINTYVSTNGLAEVQVTNNEWSIFIIGFIAVASIFFGYVSINFNMVKRIYKTCRKLGGIK